MASGSDCKTISSPTPLNSIDDPEIKCPICFEIFIDPVETNCNHRFCKSCLATWIFTNGVKKCPNCRSNIDAVQALDELASQIETLTSEKLNLQQLEDRSSIRRVRDSYPMFRSYGSNLFPTLLSLPDIDNTADESDITFVGSFLNFGFVPNIVPNIENMTSNNNSWVSHRIEVDPSTEITFHTTGTASPPFVTVNTNTLEPDQVIPRSIDNRLYSIETTLSHLRNQFEALMNLVEHPTDREIILTREIQQRLDRIGIQLQNFRDHEHQHRANEDGRYTANLNREYSVTLNPSRINSYSSGSRRSNRHHRQAHAEIYHHAVQQSQNRPCPYHTQLSVANENHANTVNSRPGEFLHVYPLNCQQDQNRRTHSQFGTPYHSPQGSDSENNGGFGMYNWSDDSRGRSHQYVDSQNNEIIPQNSRTEMEFEFDVELITSFARQHIGSSSDVQD